MITDIKQAFTSKRTIVAVLTALLIAVNSQLATPLMDEATLLKIVGIASALIVGDSLRPVAPK
jgi:hypothetical protein|tara:strand:- start:281 stop:469 length:189 start_codon:yes stop_codon:yes gene_type:complete